MTALPDLWLPILLSAVVVFIASSVIHMLPLWHRGDYAKVPREEDLRKALRPLAIPPGDYMVPRASSGKDLRSPEFLDKVNEGPVMVLTVLPNRTFSMGRNLSLWLVYLVAVALFSGYVASRALPPGAHYLRVFQVAGAVAFVGYAVALWQMSIWYQRSWILTAKATFDGLLYSLLTASMFGWLWPR
jgi:hypothetical protein